jgi:hypothetical protein
MEQFEIRVCGIPCIMQVTSYEPYQSATHDSPAEGDIEFELLDRKGYKASWLEKKADQTSNENDRLNELAWELMAESYEDAKGEAEIDRYESMLESQGIYN